MIGLHILYKDLGYLPSRYNPLIIFNSLIFIYFFRIYLAILILFLFSLKVKKLFILDRNNNLKNLCKGNRITIIVL